MRSPSQHHAVLALLAPVAFATACAAGSAADAVWPDAPTVAKATWRASCADGVASTTPLVVDWQPEVRGDLEASMERRIAVVAYDCQGIRFLEDCHLDGDYGSSSAATKGAVLVPRSA